MNLAAAFGMILVSASGTISTSYALDLFNLDDTPYGRPYEYWVQDYWRWNAYIPDDPATGYAGLSENECFMYPQGPVVMLLNPAAGGGKHIQKCEVYSGQAFLFPLWSAECDGSSKGNENLSIPQLKKCARGYNTGIVTVNVEVDNKPISTLKVIDYNTIVLNNATELYTQPFNITSPKDSNLKVDRPGTYVGVVHGWFLFVKPLTPGEHTIRYENRVEPTTLNGGYRNYADITYVLNVVPKE